MAAPLRYLEQPISSFEESVIVRRVPRILPVLALVLALSSVAALRGGRAQAWESWCFDDPVIAVDGQLIDLRVQLPLAQLLAMRSTTLTVVIPSNVRGAVVLDDVSAFPMKTVVSPTGPAWNGKGTLPLTVTTSVSATAGFPIKVVATPLLGIGAPLLGLLSPLTGTTSATGQANSPLTMPMWLARY